MVDTFIRRPILASVCSLVIVLAGALAIPTMPIAQYPDVAPPRGQRHRHLHRRQRRDRRNRASPRRSSRRSTASRACSTCPRRAPTAASARSPSRSTSRANSDLAAVDVQNRVNQALGRLPSEVRTTGVTVQKSTHQLRAGRRRLRGEGRVRLAVHVQLHRRLRQGRAQARARRRRRPDLRRAQVLDAPVARSAALAARRSRPATSSTRCASRTSTSRRAASATPRPARGRPTRSACAPPAGCARSREFDNIIVKAGDAGGAGPPARRRHGRSSAPRPMPRQLRFQGVDAVGFGVIAAAHGQRARRRAAGPRRAGAARGGISRPA